MIASNQVESVLDDFHAAASEADEERYVGHLAPHFVFLGTDPGDRWRGEEFRAFVHEFFSQGKGWTYECSARVVVVSSDGGCAWFEERLQNKSYGECRGTGVLQLHGDAWKLEQYNLSIPVPDTIAADVVESIRNARS